MVPLPLARGDFFALSCCCPACAGAQVMLLLALAAALVSWPLAWVFRLEVPPGALPCVVADVGKVCAEGCVRPGSGPAEAQLASWPWPLAPGPAPGKAAGARSAGSAHTPATAAARNIHPTAMRGTGRACARAWCEAPGAAHNGWQPQSVYAVRSHAWPAFQRTIGGLRGRVSVLDTRSGLY